VAGATFFVLLYDALYYFLADFGRSSAAVVIRGFRLPWLTTETTAQVLLALGTVALAYSAVQQGRDQALSLDRERKQEAYSRALLALAKLGDLKETSKGLISVLEEMNDCVRRNAPLSPSLSMQGYAACDVAIAFWHLSVPSFERIRTVSPTSPRDVGQALADTSISLTAHQVTLVDELSTARTAVRFTNSSSDLVDAIEAISRLAINAATAGGADAFDVRDELDQLELAMKSDLEKRFLDYVPGTSRSGN
jgi:hypothetical protein